VTRKNLILAVLSVLALVFVSAFWSRRTAFFRPAPEMRVVAVVNGQKLTYGEFSRRFTPFLASLRLPASDRRSLDEVKARFLAKMADTELLRQEAAARGIAVPPEEVDRELEALRSDLAAGGEGGGARADEERISQWRGELTDKLLLSRLMQAVTGTVSVSDDEVRRYYEGNPIEFNRPPMARARQIVTAREEEARQLRRRTLEGEDFAVLARSSIAPEAEKDGDLGLFAQGEMPEEIDAVVFSLAPGQVGRVVKSPYGWHVIRVEERLPARTLSLADAAPAIRDKLAVSRREEAFARWFPSLRGKARIVLHPENLEDPDADENR
jgi:parvulin-like peptidyl-prolyl isomerase